MASSRQQCTDEFLRVQRLEGTEGGGGICGTCRNKIKGDQQGLMCDGCERWFHAGCEHVSSGEFKYLSLCEEIMWFCKKCKNNYKEMREENKTLKEENKNLKQENEILKKRMTKLESRVETLEKELRQGLTKQLNEVETEVKKYMTHLHKENKQEIISEIEKHVLQDMKTVVREEVLSVWNGEGATIAGETKREILEDIREEFGAKLRQNNIAMENSIMQEIQEREEHQKRVNNLVLYSAAESDRENGKEREEDDRALCEHVFSRELGLENVQVESVVRLGKREP